MLKRKKIIYGEDNVQKLAKKFPMLKRKTKEVDVAAIEKRNQFFESIWNKRPHRCEVTGAVLGRIPNSMSFHHILPKQKYPELEFIEENIVILHPDIHARVEMNMYKYEEINQKREQLKKKYGIL